MRQEIIARQRRIMADNGLDALVAVSPENFAWTTGFVVPSQPILRWRHAMVVVKADGTHAVVAVDMEETTVRNRLPGEEIRVWGEFTDSAMACLAELSSDLGLALGAHRHRDGLPAGRRFRGPAARAAAGAAFSAAEQLFARSRQIKTPEEIALLRRLSRIADASITDAFAAVAGRRHRDGYRRRDDARHLRAGRRPVPADDRRHRRAQRVSQCRPDRAQARAAGRLPGRDLLDAQRLPRRRLPHRGGAVARRPTPSASGPTSSPANISSST